MDSFLAVLLNFVVKLFMIVLVQELYDQAKIGLVVNCGILLRSLEGLNHLHSKPFVLNFELLHHDLFISLEIPLPLNCQHLVRTSLELEPIGICELKLRFFLLEYTLVILAESTCQLVDLM